MVVKQISQDEFSSYNIVNTGFFLSERSWFSCVDTNIVGTVLKDPFDGDWSLVILAKYEDNIYRCIDTEVSLDTQDLAEQHIVRKMQSISIKGSIEEELYTEQTIDSSVEESSLIINDINEEVKNYLKRHPEKLYELSSRKFEELIASILKDFGFDVELTKATRDGGCDIIAKIRNSVCSYLTLIECKKYAPENKVGVGIVRGVIGVHNLKQATKSIIVTTSFFSKDAILEAKQMENQLDLKDYNDLKNLLQRY